MRLQFEVSDAMLKDIDDAVERSGSSTRAELFKNQLAFFLWALDEKEKGATIVARSPDGTERELLLPALQFAALRKRTPQHDQLPKGRVAGGV